MDLSSLAPITNAATALSNLVLVTPQKDTGYQPIPSGAKTNAQLPPGLLFHYEGENVVTLESDVTDHYIEDNTAIQDQCTLKPELITVHGFIGELNNVTPKALEFLKKAADKLNVISAYTPALSTSAILAYNEANFAYQVGSSVIDSAVSAWSSINGKQKDPNAFIGATGITNEATLDSQSKQQVAFQQFYGYWRNRTLFNVQTPWAVFQNMIIRSLRAIQDAETRMITDFEINFKMIRTASVQTLNSPVVQGRLDAQSSKLVDHGVGTPSSSINLTSGLTMMGVA